MSVVGEFDGWHYNRCKILPMYAEHIATSVKRQEWSDEERSTRNVVERDYYYNIYTQFTKRRQSLQNYIICDDRWT